MDPSATITIHELMNRYAHAIDAHDLVAVEACFTNDASFAIEVADGISAGPFEGRAAILDLVRGAYESQSDRRRHVVTNIFVDPISDASAHVTSNLTLFSIANGELTPLTTGVYRDRVVRTNVRWQIEQRHLKVDLPY